MTIKGINKSQVQSIVKVGISPVFSYGSYMSRYIDVKVGIVSKLVSMITLIKNFVYKDI